MRGKSDKDKVRAVVNTLPYNLTEKMEGWLVIYAVNRIVLVPTRNSVEYSSPREKLYGRKINVDKELKHGFGDYVQVQSNSDNRTVGCCIPYDLSYTDNTYAFNMTVTEGISKLGNIAVESIKKEMKQMCEKEVWEGVLINSLSPLQKKSIITSSIFLKDK